MASMFSRPKSAYFPNSILTGSTVNQAAKRQFCCSPERTQELTLSTSHTFSVYIRLFRSRGVSPKLLWCPVCVLVEHPLLELQICKS